MIKLFPRIIKMKRVIKSSTTSCSTSTRRKRNKDAEVAGSNANESADQAEEATPKPGRKLRGTKPKLEVKIEEDDGASEKVDLSRFKLASKQTMKSESSSSKPTKRQHIEVQYDEVSSSNKIKKESHSSDDSDDDVKTDKKVAPVVQSSGKKMPPHWEEVLANLREMRKNLDAPVDTMGCDQCPDDTASPKDKRFQSLLSLMLSSQTKDQVTHAAMLRLREHGCSLENILNTPDAKIGELIYPVSFWKTKVKNIKKTAEMIRDTFEGDIPKTAEDLCKLAGVGPKMAHLCMKSAWGEITGIGVDTHVHRITNRLGWVKSKNPEGTRKALEDWLPRDVWEEVNLLLVGFGQQTCLPIKPKCTICLNNGICPIGIKELRSVGKGKK